MELSWLGLAVAGGVAVIWSLAAYALLKLPSVRQRAEALISRRDAQARALRWPIPGHLLATAQLIALCGVAVPLTLGGGPGWGGLVCLCAVGPDWLLTTLRRRRTARLESQLDGWLLILANALRATPSLPAALDASAQLVSQPLRGELELTLREHRLGVSLEEALAQMSSRLDSRVTAVALALVSIARRTGGELSRTLEVSAANLRESIRLDAVLRSRTAEGRAQATLIALLPVPLILFIHHSDPHFLRPLTADPTGRLLAGAAVCLWASALLIARRIVQPPV